MDIQDYIYYRTYKYYQKKKKKKDIPVMTGVYFVFVIQYSLFFFFGIAFNFLTGGLLSNKHLSKEVFWSVFLGSAFILFILNLVRYLNEKKRKEIERKFNSSSYNKFNKNLVDIFNTNFDNFGSVYHSFIFW